MTELADITGIINNNCQEDYFGYVDIIDIQKKQILATCVNLKIGKQVANYFVHPYYGGYSEIFITKSATPVSPKLITNLGDLISDF